MRNRATCQRDEFSLCTSKFESDMPSHAVGLADLLAAIAPHRTSSAFRRPLSARETGPGLPLGQTTDRNAARPDASGLRLRRRRMRRSSGASRLRFCVCQRSLQALEQYTALLLRPWIGCLHSRHTPMYITPLHTVATVEGSHPSLTMTSARWHHSATDGENALSSPTRSRL